MPSSTARSTTRRCSAGLPRTMSPAFPPQPKPISETRSSVFSTCRYCTGASLLERELRQPRPPALPACWRLLLCHPVGLFVELENEFPVGAVAVHVILNVLPPGCGHF